MGVGDIVIIPELPRQTERLSGNVLAAVEAEEGRGQLHAMGWEVVGRWPAAAAVLSTEAS